MLHTARCCAGALTYSARPAALIHVMKANAVQQCKAEQKAYADCVRGRTVSVVRRLSSTLFNLNVVVPRRV